MFISMTASATARQAIQEADNRQETATLQQASVAPTIPELNPTEQAQILLNYFHQDSQTAIQQILSWLNITRASYGGGADNSLESWKGA